MIMLIHLVQWCSDLVDLVKGGCMNKNKLNVI